MIFIYQFTLLRPLLFFVLHTGTTSFFFLLPPLLFGEFLWGLIRMFRRAFCRWGLWKSQGWGYVKIRVDCLQNEVKLYMTGRHLCVEKQAVYKYFIL